MKTYENVVLDFIREKFGTSIADELIKRELKLHGLKSLSELNYKSQIKFFENFIRKRYSQFLSKSEIDSRIMQLNLHYCALKASEKISKELKNKVSIEAFEIKLHSPISAVTKLKKLSNNSVLIESKVSGDISAKAIFFFSNKDAAELTQALSLSSGKNNLEGSVDKSLLKKFLNIILPTLLESISQLLGNSISINIPEIENEEDLKEDIKDETVFFSEVPLKLNDKNLSFNIMVIIN
jgi:chemotaxis protein CheY-P-specific phosphatase CheC